MAELNIDICFCLETTKNMLSISGNVKKLLKSFPIDFIERMEDSDIVEVELRTKFILFKDFGCCPDAIQQTEFMPYTPDTVSDYENIVDGIEFKGGYGFCNAYEAIALALKSDWTTGGYRRRHIIIVISNGKVHQLQAKKGVSQYPDGMPKNIAELSHWWHEECLSEKCNYKPQSGRMAVISSEFNELYVWNRVCGYIIDSSGNCPDADEYFRGSISNMLVEYFIFDDICS